MLRFLLFILLVYLIWKVVQNVFRAMGSPGGQVHGSKTSGQKAQQDYKSVTDAEFEDLPNKTAEGTRTPPK